MLYNCIELQ